MSAPHTNIDEHIAQCPEEIRPRLSLLRRTIREAAPDAAGKISWAMPTFYLKGNLIHFAPCKKPYRIVSGYRVHRKASGQAVRPKNYKRRRPVAQQNGFAA